MNNITREQARAAGEMLQALLPGASARWELAGSYRRGRSECKDLEHVIIPKIGPVASADLFATPEDRNLVHHGLDRLVREGGAMKALVNGSPRWGQRYRKLIHADVVHDLFFADEINFGAILAIRTGSANYSAFLVSELRRHGLRMEGGYVWQGDALLPTPDEESFFRFAGVPFNDPEDRQ